MDISMDNLKMLTRLQNFRRID